MKRKVKIVVKNIFASAALLSAKLSLVLILFFVSLSLLIIIIRQIFYHKEYTMDERVFGYLSQFVTETNTVVMRILSPADYGILAMATVFVAFLGMMAQFGVGAAAIQASDMDDANDRQFFASVYGWFDDDEPHALEPRHGFQAGALDQAGVLDLEAGRQPVDDDDAALLGFLRNDLDHRDQALVLRQAGGAAAGAGEGHRLAVERVVGALDLETLRSGGLGRRRVAGDRDHGGRVGVGLVGDGDLARLQFSGIVGLDQRALMGDAVDEEGGALGLLDHRAGRQQHPCVLLRGGIRAGGHRLADQRGEAWRLGAGKADLGRQRQHRRAIAHGRAIVGAIS